MGPADKYREELLEDIMTTELFGLRNSDEIEEYLELLEEEYKRVTRKSDLEIFQDYHTRALDFYHYIKKKDYFLGGQ